MSKIYVQAKRSINLSDDLTSDFSKVINQFVAQYLNGIGEKDRCILATSSKASSKITRDLRKITESIKNNDDNFLENPLNQSEEDTLRKLVFLIDTHYQNISGVAISNSIRNEILKKIRVSILDIEEGHPLEKALIILLSGQTNVSSSLIWANLISIGLTLSKERSSINKAGLLRRVGKYFQPITEKKESVQLSDLLKIEFKSNVAAGRDVLLAKVDGNLVIAELYRFDSTGEKRLKYLDGYCEFQEGTKWEVISRAATYVGIERFIENNVEQLKSKNEITIFPINGDNNFDEDPISIAHAELCIQHFQRKLEPLVCIHCGDPISDDGLPLIEVDNEKDDFDFGFVHSECIKPLDRLVGRLDAELFRENKAIKNFDYRSWFTHIQHGQGLFASYPDTIKAIAKIAWKPDYSDLSRGAYCVKITLEDGSTRYVTERNKVARETLDSAKQKSKQFNEAFYNAEKIKNPWCFTSIGGSFTTYSKALEIKMSDEECILCKSAEPAPYTLLIDKLHSACKNFYAPLILILEKDTGLPLVIDNTLTLVTDPLNFTKQLSNWEKGGLILPNYSLSIIKSDSEFDVFVGRAISDGLNIIINPLLDMKGGLISAFLVENYYEIINKGSN
ncbi:MAG TPA: hypothetical protein PLN39_02790 [Candidatus Dojkabacteria bacterium]|nr:hypothetical protein [Candidatus Dojkabacteria bacterium]